MHGTSHPPRVVGTEVQRSTLTPFSSGIVSPRIMNLLNMNPFVFLPSSVCFGFACRKNELMSFDAADQDSYSLGISERTLLPLGLASTGESSRKV